MKKYEHLSACLQPLIVGHCLDFNNYREMFYFDQNLKKCITFIYSGCNGNKNRFKSLKQCNLECLVF